MNEFRILLVAWLCFVLGYLIVAISIYTLKCQAVLVFWELKLFRLCIERSRRCGGVVPLTMSSFTWPACFCLFFCGKTILLLPIVKNTKTLLVDHASCTNKLAVQLPVVMHLGQPRGSCFYLFLLGYAVDAQSILQYMCPFHRIISRPF